MFEFLAYIFGRKPINQARVCHQFWQCLQTCNKASSPNRRWRMHTDDLFKFGANILLKSKTPHEILERNGHVLEGSNPKSITISYDNDFIDTINMLRNRTGYEADYLIACCLSIGYAEMCNLKG